MSHSELTKTAWIGLLRIVRRYYPALLALPLVLYLAIPTRNYYWDGIAFANDIEKHAPGAVLVHPNHLVYALWSGWLYGRIQELGFHTRSLFVMQVVNSILAGLSVWLFYFCLRLRGIHMPVAVPVALAFGFTATWWRFATDANAYVPSIFLLLTAYILLASSKNDALAGFAHAGAIVFHQLAIFSLPLALVRLRGRPRGLAAYLACALLPVTAGYIAAYRAVSPQPTWPGLLAWVTYHSPDSEFSFRPLVNLALTIRGTFRLFFGGRISDFAGDRISWGVLFLAVLVSIAFLVHCWRVRGQGAALSSAPRHLFIWAGCYALFLYFWMPQNTFYRLFYLPPLLIVFAFLLRSHAGAAWRFLPVLFLWNFAFVIYPQSRAEFNAPLHFALVQRDKWPAGSPIVFYKFHPDLWTISYFNMQAAWISLERADTAELDRHLAYAHSENKPLWLEATAYELVAAVPAGRQWLAAHERPGELLEFRDEKHHFQFRCFR